MPVAALPLPHVLLALAVVAVWGTNFVVIKYGLVELPPLAFAALRFFFALVPAVFFLLRPMVPWRHLAAYGVLIGAGQFGLLYIAMNGQISPGLASLVVQVQVFFTIGLAMAAAGERVRRFQIAALVLATAGVGVILAHSDRTTTPLGLALVILAAMGWAGGNHVAKLSGRVNMLAYVVWASLFSVPPLVVMSLVLEGWPTVRAALVTASPAAWATVVWQSVGNTLFGYAAWGWLLARHPAATITPMALLVPVFGMGASALLLGEAMPVWKIGAAALVMAGLTLNILWPIVAARRLPPPAA
ncbi:MAG: EamA family transporter [Phenylobacterium sp.]|uniref:EamA family transporter n=1 Tax=Phenylobacterium sp. TaxID=1871053 RepID=UPI002717F496|nr:EamA family transporter [Phenylobacterium sp.]MDO8409575.1 EamA family transporter [Phenylobacterium sp.]